MPREKDPYSLEELIKTFGEHTEKAQKNHEACVRLFMENNPDTQLPDHLKDDFNICKALLTFSREIKDLKESLKALKPHSSEESPASS
jgi:hypothetical protein